MKRLLPGSIVALLVFCMSTAGAQNPLTIHRSPVNPAGTSRIVEVAPSSPFREKQTPTVEVFDRQRALEERQKLMLDGMSERPAYPTQPVSAAQPLPQTSIVTPPLASSPAIPPVVCDCDLPEKVPGRHWRRLLLQEQCAAAREMFPRHEYQAPHGSAYYFRPYMAEHIGRQADIVGGWGGDRTNPYDNRFLQAIYAPRSE